MSSKDSSKTAKRVEDDDEGSSTVTIFSEATHETVDTVVSTDYTAAEEETAEEKKEREKREKEKARQDALLKQWARRGKTAYGRNWQFLAKSKVQAYVNTAKKFTSQVLTESHPGVGLGRLAYSTDDDAKVKRAHPCKYLHLGSRHNGLARAIDSHIKENGNGLVQGSKKWDALAPLRSFLSAVDDVPSNYTVEHFRDELIEMLVTQQADVIPLLKPQMEKTTRSYKDLILDFHAGKELQSGIDFYLAAARLFVGEPVLLVKAKVNKKPEEGTTGPSYIFDKQYLIESDKFVAPSKVQMRFIFNGVNYYAPYYKDRVASIVRQGQPLMRDIQSCFRDLGEIRKRMPPGKNINSGLNVMYTYMEAAATIAARTNFATGESDTSIVEEQPAPAMNPLIAASLRKRKSTQKDAHRKKPKTVHLPQVDISEHIEQMDKTAQKQQSTSETHQSHDDSAAAVAVPIHAPSLSLTEEEDSRLNELLEEDDTTDLGANQCVCGIEYDSWEELLNHRGLIHENDSFVCSWQYQQGDQVVPCGEEFDKENSMWRHYRSVHLGKFYFYCPVKGCTSGKNGAKYGADGVDAVKKHMHEVHKLQSDLKCPQCPYVAGSKYKLQLHLDICQVDKKIKKYKCGECDKGFRDKGRLAKHERQDHPEDPEDTSAWYYCEYEGCDKKYRTISGRRKHMKSHEEESQENQ